MVVAAVASREAGASPVVASREAVASPVGGAPGGGFGGPGGVFGGPAGWLRMFSDAVGGQIAWLLPAAIVGALFALWAWRRDRVRMAGVALFAGWLGLYFVIFSNAEGIFHSYYTSVMAPAVAALVGIGGVAVMRAMSRRVAMLAAAAVALTAWVQWTVASRTPRFHVWSRWSLLALAAVAIAGLVAMALRPAWRRHSGAVLLVALAGLLVVPAAWTLSEAANPTLNATLPQAGPRGGAAGGTFGSLAFGGRSAAADDELAAWLSSQRGSERWDLVTSSAMSASSLEADQGLSVMALGGFSGSDPASTPARFADQVEAGQVRFVLVGGGFPGGGAARRRRRCGRCCARPGRLPERRCPPGGPVPGAGGGRFPVPPPAVVAPRWAIRWWHRVQHHRPGPGCLHADHLGYRSGIPIDLRRPGPGLPGQGRRAARGRLVLNHCSSARQQRPVCAFWSARSDSPCRIG